MKVTILLHNEQEQGASSSYPIGHKKHQMTNCAIIIKEGASVCLALDEGIHLLTLLFIQTILVPDAKVLLHFFWNCAT